MAFRKLRTTSRILSRAFPAPFPADGYVGAAGFGFGRQPAASAALKILPAPVALGGEPLISYQRWSVMAASYLPERAENSSKISNPRCDPPLAANIANAQVVHSSQLRLPLGMKLIASSSSSRSHCGVPSK